MQLLYTTLRTFVRLVSNSESTSFDRGEDHTLSLHRWLAQPTPTRRTSDLLAAYLKTQEQ